MTSIPIVFLYDSRYYKGDVTKIAGVPVEYHFSKSVPPLFINLPLIFVSDPIENILLYKTSELNHCIAAAIIESCTLLEEPLHV